MSTPRLEKILERLGNERRINYDLERLLTALKSLGSPEKTVQTFVIAGTNGKGSTTLFLSSALVEAGFSVVTYLSPHLQSPTERILNNLVPAEEPSLSDLAESLLPTADHHQLSYFEFMTVLVLVWAKQRKVDFLVLEVGLGGRLDATNVTHPIACAITNIDYDHQEYLGTSLPEILNEKLGVLRPDGLLFTGIQDPELLAIVEKRCLELDTIYYYSHELNVEPVSASWLGQRIRINGAEFDLGNPSTGTVKNAALAFLLMQIVFPKIPVSLLQRAFKKVRTPGRMEVVHASPRIVLSGDHNPAGIDCLKTTLTRIGAERVRTICGFSPDKPYALMYQSLAEISEDIILTQVTRLKDNMPSDYANLAKRFFADPAEAVKIMLEEASPEDTILITGSLYLIGELRPRWHSKVEFR